MIEKFDICNEQIMNHCDPNQVLNVSRRYWADFAAFAKEKYGLETLDQVERTHAEAYIAHISAPMEDVIQRSDIIKKPLHTGSLFEIMNMEGS